MMPNPAVSCPLVVRYPASLRVQRVGRLTVSGHASEVPGACVTLPVLVRPVIPGALVTPPERVLDVAREGAEAVFHVTALASGRWPQAGVEVTREGLALATLPLSMRGKTLCLTKWLAALTVLLTVFLVYAFEYHDWTTTATPPERVPDAESPNGFRLVTPKAPVQRTIEKPLPDGAVTRRLGERLQSWYDDFHGIDHFPFWCFFVLALWTFASWLLSFNFRRRLMRHVSIPLPVTPHQDSRTEQADEGDGTVPSP